MSLSFNLFLLSFLIAILVLNALILSKLHPKENYASGCKKNWHSSERSCSYCSAGNCSNNGCNLVQSNAGPYVCQ